MKTKTMTHGRNIVSVASTVQGVSTPRKELFASQLNAAKKASAGKSMPAGISPSSQRWRFGSVQL